MLRSSKKSSVICLFKTFPRYKSSSRVIISRGVAMFSRPSAAAFTSIIFLRRRVCVRPSESRSAFTFSMPMRSMMILVAELSLTEIISAEQIFLSRREVKNGDPKDAVKIAVNPGDCRFQLLPQDLLFLLGSFYLRNLLRARRHRGPDYDSKQSKEEKSFQHGDLRVSGIIRRIGAN